MWLKAQNDIRTKYDARFQIQRKYIKIGKIGKSVMYLYFNVIDYTSREFEVYILFYPAIYTFNR